MALDTTSAVIDELGGISAVGKLTGATYAAVWNWKNANSFPAKTYILIMDALRARDKAAPAALWKMANKAVAVQHHEFPE